MHSLPLTISNKHFHPHSVNFSPSSQTVFRLEHQRMVSIEHPETKQTQEFPSSSSKPHLQIFETRSPHHTSHRSLSPVEDRSFHTIPSKPPYLPLSKARKQSESPRSICLPGYPFLPFLKPMDLRRRPENRHGSGSNVRGECRARGVEANAWFLSAIL